MKVKIISHSLSTNAAGRAYLIAQLLSKFAEVKLVGPIYSRDVWYPIKNSDLEILPIEYSSYIDTFKKIVREVDPKDVIYSIKPYPHSFGVGWYCKHKFGNKWIADIDDYEFGFAYVQESIQRSLYYTFNPVDPNNLLIALILSEMAKKVSDGVTVSSNLLQKKYGGLVLPHLRDTDHLDPKKINRPSVRKRLNIGNKKVILFLGTPVKHKGLDDLIEAYKNIKYPGKTSLMIVGTKERNTYQNYIKDKNKSVNLLGQVKFSKLPEYLSVADIVVIPQKDSVASRFQTPAKLTDAMAMGKAIISTNISVIPEMLGGGCGIVIEPNNPAKLSEKIDYLLNNPIKARRLGNNARRKCVQTLSYNAYEKKLRKYLYSL